MKHRHRMPFGAQLLDGGGVRFRLWAPAAQALVLELRHGGGETWRAAAMEAIGEGWWEACVADAAAGDMYRYRLPDGLCVPDPASRANPQDVHGPSQVIDPHAYDWRRASWNGRPWHEAVIYELHVGAFTPEGSFEAAQHRLGELAELGFTAIELMPLADFPGRRGWGYDGALPFAPDASYGTPEDLKRLVDAAHALGLMVLIDVVYNHFGPEGNYLHAYCPPFFDAARQTPWGAAINFDGPGSRTVRDFFIHNALYWIEEFRFDGLRMDAVHAIRDDSTPDIVQEICAALCEGAQERRVHVVLENDLNQAHRLRRHGGRPLEATAQWNDDLHHAAHVLLTGESDGYYLDFADRPLERFALALARGFVYAGEPSAFRAGEPRGEPCNELPLPAFVSYLQTHDQVGNRALGERIDALADPALVQAVRACVLLSPHVPMLFMGEEFAASSPFLYFCDFGPDLAAAVSAGRRAEFAHFAAFSSGAAQEAVPDPNADESFDASRLKWEERGQPGHAEVLHATRALLQARRAHIVPHLAGTSTGLRSECADAVLRVSWRLGEAPGSVLLHLVANFAGDERRVPRPAGTRIHSLLELANGGAGMLRLARGGVYASLEEARDA
ncbi:MAG TPA: malto-oligosyltrehalose trehalohydrolase [Variovorax sp.]|nr:malto-oligosyltrehalose trehalohydrolase [Variovorax sp.]